MNLEKIPATIVTGFLGSGKTTLLSNIIKQSAGKRIAVIVNEFGELDIDADLLRSCPLECEEGEVRTETAAIPEDGIYELANGCICCTVEEEFLPVMKQLVARRNDIDHILIETSGLALPKPLVQAFNWPEIKQHCTVDSVITVVDGPAIADGRIAHDPEQVEKQRGADENLDHDPSLQELLEDQLSSADMVLISKTDLVAGEQLASIRKQLAGRLNARVKILEIAHGEISNDLILGQKIGSEDGIESVHTHHDHHHRHDEKHHHAHDDFNSVSITLGEVDSDRLVDIVGELVAGNTIFRIKGFLAIPGKPMRQVLQGVGERFERYFDRPWNAGEARQSKLVLIGKDLVADNLRAQLEAALV